MSRPRCQASQRSPTFLRCLYPLGYSFISLCFRSRTTKPTNNNHTVSLQKCSRERTKSSPSAALQAVSFRSSLIDSAPCLPDLAPRC